MREKRFKLAFTPVIPLSLYRLLEKISAQTKKRQGKLIIEALEIGLMKMEADLSGMPSQLNVFGEDKRNGKRDCGHAV